MTTDAELLAIDLGLRTGFALYRGDGRLSRYGSRHFGSRAQLRRAAIAMLDDFDSVDALVVEGGGDVAVPWCQEAEKRQLLFRQIQAETWRKSLLHDREQRTGELAKAHAGRLARQVIEWSGAPRPTSLRHDAAEAIVAGLWGVMEFGRLADRPPFLRF